MQTGTGYGFVAVHQVLTLAESVQEHGHGTDIDGVRTNPQQVVQYTGDLGKHDTDVLRTLRHLDTHQFFDGQAVSVLVTHHGHIVQTVHVRQGLDEGLAFGQFLGAAMQQADMRVGTLYHFTIQLQNQAQYTVRGRVLRAEVQRVITDFSHRSSPRGRYAA